MKCKNETCDNDAKGNGWYCSATCKTVFNRNKNRNTVTPKSVTIPAVTDEKPAVTVVTPPTVTVADADRIRPGSIPLPGDADYKGVCEKVDGSFQVKTSNKPTSQAITADKFKVIKSKLAGGVAQPTGLPTKATGSMSAVELRNGVSSYVGQDWLASSEYAEVCLRLVTWTKARLIESGQAVPAWKDTL